MSLDDRDAKIAQLTKQLKKAKSGLKSISMYPGSMSGGRAIANETLNRIRKQGLILTQDCDEVCLRARYSEDWDVCGCAKCLEWGQKRAEIVKEMRSEFSVDAIEKELRSRYPRAFDGTDPIDQSNVQLKNARDWVLAYYLLRELKQNV